ncbi:methyltransferase [Lentzea sp. NPDC059081]|uniref:methyltransferase n=1 Tax=Lentzea sp. NPDC059081 TaxID=3346719 RepID=UPI0036C0FAF9
MPAGGDLYLVKHIIHDWPDEQAVSSLRDRRRAMSPGSRLVLFERLAVPGDSLTQTVTYAFLLMVVLGGQERTKTEYDRLLAAAGLRLDRVVPAGGELVGIEAVLL